MTNKIHVPIMADLAAKGEKPEYLYWVGCAGAFDDRYQKVARAFAKILNHLTISYAVLGTEESCTGDAAKRAGNEMLFQMQAMQNIEVLNGYEVKKIICTCPHCYNTLKNEYPDLGGNYQVINYAEFLEDKIQSNELVLTNNPFQGESITYHDPCYLGRGNKVYDAPRNVIKAVFGDVKEMKRSRSFGFCCGAGGAQMFKEAEKGDKEVNIDRTEEVIACKVDKVASACPFCMTMLTDGLKFKEKEQTIQNLDVAEIIEKALNL